MPSLYANMLLGLHFLHAQTLSLIDVSMGFKQKVVRGQPVGMVTGELERDSLLLTSPLVLRGPPKPDEVPEQLKILAAINKQKNPVVK